MIAVWMEARCDRVVTLMHPNRCHETGPGGFYAAIKGCIRDTKRAGWVLIDSEWVCPACKKAEPR